MRWAHRLFKDGALAMVAHERAARWERIIERQRLSRKDLLAIGIFMAGHGELTLVRAVYEFLRGRGPAAVARGRSGLDTLTRPIWQPRSATVSHVAVLTPHEDAVTVWAELAPELRVPLGHISLVAGH
jgi:hypothetical protein